jgi:hypothetical protein
MITFFLRGLEIQVQERFEIFDNRNARFSILFIIPLISIRADIRSDAIAYLGI